MSKLTPKQEAFVKEYLIDLNGTAAAKRAGYTGSDNVLANTAHNLLRNPKVAAVIQEAMDKRSERTEITADVVLKELLLIARADLSQAYADNGKLLPIKQIPEDVRRAIAGIKVFEEFEGMGKDRIQIGEVREVKFWDKPKALELLGRHLKLFTDKIEHGGKEGGPIVILTMPANGSEAKPEDDGGN